MVPANASNSSMLQLLDIMDEAAALFDLDGTVIMANAAGAARLGLAREDLIGRCIYDLLPADVADFRRRLLDEVVATGKPLHFADMSNGRWLENRVCPIFDDAGRVNRLAIYSADVTERRLVEQERLASTSELETIQAHVPVGLILLDVDRRITKANPAAARMAGVTREQVIGRVGGAGLGCLNHLDDPRGCGYGPSCDRCELRLAVKSAAEDDMVIDGLPVTLPVAGPDGPVLVHFLISAAPVAINGRHEVLVSLQDITRLRRAEADVAFKAMALDQISDCVTMTDLEATIVYVNDATCRSLQMAREQLVGRSVGVYGEDPTRGATQRETIDRTLAEGQWQGEVVNVAGDGARHTLHCRTSLVRDEQGEPVGMCSVATDISETKRSQGQLLESERRFRRLHEQLPIGYFGLDREGRYVDANPAWLKLLGRGREEIENQPFAGLLAVAHTERFAAARCGVQDGREEQIEIEIIGAEGRQVTVFCVGRGGRDEDGAVETTHWVAADVSERRRLESQLWQAQKLDALGRLAAGVAHDFNNQLTVISGYCDMLLADTPEGHALRPAMQQIRRATERAASTTGHLLTFSRKRALSPTDIDLNVLVNELLHPVGKLISENIRIRTEFSPQLRTVCVDAAGLQQALFNLILNARDAMFDGGNLVLRTANRPSGGSGPHSVALTVEDTGSGIATAVLDRVFEPFFSTKPEGKGTGLGLSMVRGFIEQSGGTVEIESRSGAGTKVTLVLPAADHVAAAPAPASPAAPVFAPGTRILVVEDSDQVRNLVADILRQCKAEVVTASSPTEALAVTTSGPPFALLLTDIVMPGMRGDDLAAQLLDRGRVLRVVYMSGYHEGPLQTSQWPLVAKPFAVLDLLEVVGRTLAGAAATASAPMALEL
ncbi:MAG: PAS domain-containing protein [bacterium]|nr:PAS domain-containing protein [bacterium]